MKQVNAIAHTDVRGKIQYYLKITKGAHEVLINIGEKTYKNVQALDAVEELALQTETNENTTVDNKNKKR